MYDVFGSKTLSYLVSIHLPTCTLLKIMKRHSVVFSKQWNRSEKVTQIRVKAFEWKGEQKVENRKNTNFSLNRWNFTKDKKSLVAQGVHPKIYIQVSAFAQFVLSFSHCIGSLTNNRLILLKMCKWKMWVNLWTGWVMDRNGRAKCG